MVGRDEVIAPSKLWQILVNLPRYVTEIRRKISKIERSASSRDALGPTLGSFKNARGRTIDRDARPDEHV